MCHCSWVRGADVKLSGRGRVFLFVVVSLHRKTVIGRGECEGLVSIDPRWTVGQSSVGCLELLENPEDGKWRRPQVGGQFWGLTRGLWV